MLALRRKALKRTVIRAACENDALIDDAEAKAVLAASR